MRQKVCVVTGAGGFIGGHMCQRLKNDGHFVIGVDIELNRYGRKNYYDHFYNIDLRDEGLEGVFLSYKVDEVYHLAADMGGMGFISENHYNILQNNLRINLNVARSLEWFPNTKLFFSSSVCIYPEQLQDDQFIDHPAVMLESYAYPAQPQDEYGWEKLMAERIFTRLHVEYGVDVHIGRLHNTYGPFGAWIGGREKAPAALCRKVAVSKLNGQDPTIIDVWGDGQQKRPFIYVYDTVEAIIRLMATDYHDPVNIGPSNDAIVTIDELAWDVYNVSGLRELYHREGEPFIINHVPTTAEGVRSRGASNDLLQQVLEWKPQVSLSEGLYYTYQWIEEQVRQSIDADSLDVAQV